MRAGAVRWTAARAGAALGAAALAAAALATTVGVAAPAGAQEPPPDTRTVTVSFSGICEPVGSPYRPRPGTGSAYLEVPTSVERGETLRIRVLGVSGPPRAGELSVVDARFSLAGGTPEVAGTDDFPDRTFDPVGVTATGEPGTAVTVGLTHVGVRSLPPPGYPLPAVGEDCRAVETPDHPGEPAVTATIPIVAPTCQGRAATVVGLPDQPTVAGTAGNDVIVAWAPGASIAPGTGRDRVCARAGDGTLSFADAARGVLASIDQGAGGDGRHQVRFEGIAHLQGSPHPDGLVGDAGGNTLRGGAGDDVLVGLAGTDALDGQAGRNVLVGDQDDTCTNGTPVGCGTPTTP